jgi:hypothetical protein
MTIVKRRGSLSGCSRSAKTGPVPDPIDELREVVRATQPAPGELAGYLTKVRERAYALTDGEVAALKKQIDEDVIFEQTVAAAIGEGLRRLDRANEAIG